MSTYKLNYPIETQKAQEFWASKHRLNRIKAIIAFSLDLDNANDNLRRAGYYRQYRKRYLEIYDCIVNNPKMDGSDGKGDIPFSDTSEYWYNPIHICPLIPPSIILTMDTNQIVGTNGNKVTFTITGTGSGKYNAKVTNGTIVADDVSIPDGTNPVTYVYTYEAADGFGTFTVVITDRDDPSKTATKTFTVTDPNVVVYPTSIQVENVTTANPTIFTKLNDQGYPAEVKTKTLTVEVLPANATDRGWTVTSSNTAVAKATKDASGKLFVEPVGEGTTTITLTSTYDAGVTLDVLVEVLDIGVHTPSAITLQVGQTIDFDCYSNPEKVGAVYTWSSNHPEFATVAPKTGSDGTVAQVTAVDAGGVTISCTVEYGGYHFGGPNGADSHTGYTVIPVPAANYIGFRMNGASTTVPATTDPFSYQGEGHQTVKVKMGTPIRVLAALYPTGSTNPISQGTASATFTPTDDTGIATVDLAGATKYDFDIVPVAPGTTKFTVNTTTPKVAKGELTIVVEA